MSDHITEMLAKQMREGRGASEDHAVVMSQIHADAEAITPAFIELVEALRGCVEHLESPTLELGGAYISAVDILSKYTPKAQRHD